MALPDRKYKILFDNDGIARAWISLACRRLELGDPDLDSIRDLPTVRNLSAWGDLLEQIQDRCWRFRTRQGESVLLACEVQSAPDFLIMMRLLAYASSTVVALDRAEHFSRRRLPPLPCLLLIYTGARAWNPPGMAVLTGGRVSNPAPLFPYLYMDVLHGNFHTWDLPQELELMVQAERTRTPSALLTGNFPENVAALPDPHTVRALVDFMKLTMLAWAEQSAHDQAIQDALHYDLQKITTPEELAMAAQEYQRGYFAVKEEGRQEGLQEGRQEGRQEGLFQAKVDLMVEMLLPAAGTEFEEELRLLLGDERLVSRLDVNTIVDLRIQHSADPAGLRQAVRTRLGSTDPAN